MSDKIIILVEEPVMMSIYRDTYTVVAAIVLIGIGVYFSSVAMEVFGFFMVSAIVAMRAVGVRKDMSMTPDEAINRINEIKKERNIS